jgi:hypothetical protein
MFQIFRRSVAQQYVQRMAAYWQHDADHAPVATSGVAASLDAAHDRFIEARALSRVGLGVGAAASVIAAVAAQAPAAQGWAGDLMAAAGMLANYAAPGGFVLYGASRLSAMRIAAQMGHAGVDAVPRHPDGVASMAGLVGALRRSREGEDRAALLARAHDVITRLASPAALDVAEFLLEVDHKAGGEAALQWGSALPEKIAQEPFVRATMKGIELRLDAQAQAKPLSTWDDSVSSSLRA